MKKLIAYFETEKGMKMKNMITCIGAAVVILGALFKITHWPGAMPMLILGMSVEAVLFVMFGVLPPHKEYHWEKYYPGLDINPHAEHEYEASEHGGDHEHDDAIEVADPGMADSHSVEAGSLSEQLDAALNEAEIDQNIVDSLGLNLGKLGDGLNALGQMSDMAVATNEFSEKAMGAAKGLEAMDNAYSKATDAASSLAGFAEGAGSYNDAMTTLSTNLSSLNEMYELELQNSGNALRSVNQFYDNVNSVMENLEQSAEDTKMYREQVAMLAQNISTLNNIYGNMLTAMSAGGQNQNNY